jgi:hypothetical protein
MFEPTQVKLQRSGDGRLIYMANLNRTIEMMVAEKFAKPIYEHYHIKPLGIVFAVIEQQEDGQLVLGQRIKRRDFYTPHPTNRNKG